MYVPPSQDHVWFSPADIALLLDATHHGKEWRAACPAHAGDNPCALSIAEGRDVYGNPATLLHCFAHDCTIEEMCQAMGIHVRNLFCMHPDYARAHRNTPRTKSPRIERLKWAARPHTADEIAQVMLEEMIVSDPEWIQTCAPARTTMWQLSQASPRSRDALTRALRQSGVAPLQFWDALALEQED